MDLKKAYQMVFNDLHECPMFQGHYDAANGNPHFMYGIETVMEVIACRGYGDDFVEDFSYEFANNIGKSKIKHKILKEGH